MDLHHRRRQVLLLVLHRHLGELLRTLHSGTMAMAVHRSEGVAIMVEQVELVAGAVITRGLGMEEM